MDRTHAKFHAKILVVDDYPVNQEVTKEMLEILNCEVDIAENGREALALCNENQYDLIFMDVQMPEMDGCQATQEIRKKEMAGHTHVPIIALTANAIEGDREKYLASGMDDYISKPIKIRDLENVLRKYLSSCLTE